MTWTKERQREYNRGYYKRNRKRERARSRKWYRENRDKFNKTNLISHLKRGLKRGYITKAEINNIINDLEKCEADRS